MAISCSPSGALCTLSTHRRTPRSARAHSFKSLPLLVGRGDEVVDRSLCVNPTQSVVENMKLARIVAYNDQIFRQTMSEHAPEKSTLRGNAPVERARDPKLVQTLLPPGIAQKTLPGVGGKTREKILGKLPAPQVFEGFLIDDIVSMPGTKKFQKIHPAFALRTLTRLSEITRYARDNYLFCL